VKLKLDAAGHVEVQDGKPVYIHDDGSEHPFDAAATVATIKTRNAEAKTNRERAEAAEATLKTFAGIDDPAAALKAIETVKGYDSSKSKDADEFNRRLADSNKTWQEKLEAANKATGEVQQQLHGEIVGGNFARSKYIAEKLAVPVDMVQATFGKHFKVADGKLVAVDAAGNTLVSKANPGANATFDEALELLVGGYPHKESILKADNKSGSGAPVNQGGGKTGTKTISRPTWDALDPVARAEHVKTGGTVTD
jgi:hypothetical protein